MNIFDWFWFAIALLFYTSLTICGAMISLQQLHSSAVELISSIVMIMGSSLIAVIVIVVDMLNRNNIWRIVGNLNEFDIKVT